MKPRYLISVVWIFVLYCTRLWSLEFEVGSVVPIYPDASVGIGITGTWVPAFPLDPQILSSPQVLVFSARNMKKVAQRLKLVTGSFATPPDAEPFRTAVASDLDFSVKLFAGAKNQDRAHYLTLVYSPTASSASGLVPARIRQAQPCIIAPDVFQSRFGNRQTKAVVWVNASLDANGVLQSFTISEQEFETLREDIAGVLKSWQFTPARENAVNVAATLCLPIPFVAAYTLPLVNKLPDPIEQYWLSMTALREKFPSLDEPLRVVSVNAVDSASLPRFGGVAGWAYLQPLASRACKATVMITKDGEVEVAIPGASNQNRASTLTKAFANWRFTPPIENGKPRSIEFEAIISLLPLSVLQGPQPAPLYTQTAKYPEEFYAVRESHELKRDIRDIRCVSTIVTRNDYARLHGSVEMAFIINTKGDVEQSIVLIEARIID